MTPVVLLYPGTMLRIISIYVLPLIRFARGGQRFGRSVCPLRAGMVATLVASLAVALAARAEAAPVPIEGHYALPYNLPKVSGSLVATSAPQGEDLDFTFFALGTKTPITRFDVELTKQPHVIAVSEDFGTFIHEHVTRADKNGLLRARMLFPRPALYHVYADGTPTGFGQQVLRFDLPVGEPKKEPVIELTPTGLSGTDGPYAVTFDEFDLVAGTESKLSMHINKDGKPATDLAPFLGVAAHAVFINGTDLTYVHSHASSASGIPGSGSQTPTSATTHVHATRAMAGMEGMSAMTTPSGSKVPADLDLHVQPPRAGLYKLWIQFAGGGQVRTVPFVLAVK